MARIRTIKPEFWHDEKIGGVRRDARLLFIGLWNYADDWGRIGGVPRVLRGLLFPFDDDIDLAACLAELEWAGVIKRYTVGRRPLIHIVNFEKHQKIDKRSKSFLPGPESADPAEHVAEPPALAAGNGGDRREMGAGSQSLPQPQSQSVEEEGAATNPELMRAIASIARPSSPPPSNSGAGFFAWVQDERVEAGFGREKPEHPSKLGAWYSQALLELGGDDGRLRAAYEGFTRNKHWENASPPWPFKAFVSTWRDYVGRKVTAESVA